jgi:hypothetical protein
MDAENQKAESGREHQKRATLFNAAEQKVSLQVSEFLCLKSSLPPPPHHFVFKYLQSVIFLWDERSKFTPK